MNDNNNKKNATIIAWQNNALHFYVHARVNQFIKALLSLLLAE